MSVAARFFVPLNRRCSRKWEAPAMDGRSSRDPTSTQTPSATERRPGISSVTTRRPEAYSLREISVTRDRVRGLKALADPLAGRRDRPCPGHAGAGSLADHGSRPRDEAAARRGARRRLPRGATRPPAGPPPPPPGLG